MLRPGVLPRVSLLRALVRLARWSQAGLILLVQVLWDRLRGQKSEAQLGRRIRGLFERVGGTAIKLGQQLSVRADLLPPAVCEQLGALSDRVPPMPESDARVLLARGLARPVEEVFSRVNWQAIGSGSVACVYEAWLLTGARVAVKLRRGGVAAAFAADLAVFEWAAGVAEYVGLLRQGLLLHLWVDLRMMLGEESSFTLEARYQRLFRKELRSANMPWISAPRVHSGLCSDSVLVTDFVEGVRFGEVLAACESPSPTARAELARQGIDPELLSARLGQFSLWVRFEGTFFHADPHPGNLFVLPGNKLVFIDFGGCGATSKQTRRHHGEVLRLMGTGDATAISAVMAADLSPLPVLDLAEFRGVIENRFRPMLLAMRDENSPWFERIAASVWLRMLESAREYGIRINLDSIRSIRAFLLYDTLVARLNPRFDAEGMIDRYMTESAVRNARLMEKQNALAAGNPIELLLAQGRSLVTQGEELIEAQPALERVIAGYRQLSEAAASAGRSALRVVLLGSVTALAILVARALEVPMTVLTSDAALLTVGVLGAATVVALGRRALFVLENVQR